jgi:hypothetical protein
MENRKTFDHIFAEQLEELQRLHRSMLSLIIYLGVLVMFALGLAICWPGGTQ